MNYQITCFCGNRFLISDQQLSGPVNCPACKRPLQPVVSEHPASPAPQPEPAPATPVSTTNSAPVSTESEPTKRCPFCGEPILAIAKKCKHCGEFLDRASPHEAPALPNASATDTQPVFTLHVSQWDNFWKYVICASIVALVFLCVIGLKVSLEIGFPVVAGSAVLAMFVAWFMYLSVKNSRCFIRPTRIDTEVGIISKDINSLELFRITDMELRQGIVQRLLGIGTIHITSSDPHMPDLVLYQIPHARKVLKYLQDQIPIATKQRGAVFMQK